MFQFRQGRSLFHRLDPGTKFIWLACISVLSLRYEDAAFQAALLAAVLLAGRCAAGLTLREQWRGLQAPFWFGVPYFALQLLFVPGETVWFAIGPLAITTEAANFAAAISLRLLTLVLASIVFIAATDPRDVVLALAQQLRVPYRYAFAVSIALRFLPILVAEAGLVRSALRLRGGRNLPLRFRARLSLWRSFAFAVFAGAVRRVQTMAESMDGRAFGLYPDRTYLRTMRTPPAGMAWSAACLAGTAALLLFR